jgi:amidohydrolase
MSPAPIRPETLAKDLVADAVSWRQQLHRKPELMFDVHETARFVTERLTQFGVDEIATGIGRTGVVGVIKGKRDSSRGIGLRSDMDALPIKEESGKPWASTTPGKMHACGHDGHMAMLLGAARYLAETRDFAGHVAVIFQPAEEGGGGGRLMVEEGMMDRFGITEVYGMHNMPGLPLGMFGIRPGPLMAAADRFRIAISGRGGHAAKPHECIDPVLIAAHIITATQSIVSRNLDPIQSCVVSITKMNGGEAFNVIPAALELIGTVRTLDEGIRDFAERRLREIVEGTAATFGGTATLEYARGYPVTVNHPAETAYAAAAAETITAAGAVNTDADPVMGAEDFSYMLRARPGAFIFIGNGDTAGLHHPAYDFNDAAMPHGIAYWATLACHRLAG